MHVPSGHLGEGDGVCDWRVAFPEGLCKGSGEADQAFQSVQGDMHGKRALNRGVGSLNSSCSD